MASSDGKNKKSSEPSDYTSILEEVSEEDNNISHGITSNISHYSSEEMSGDWMENMMNMEGSIEDFRRAYLQEIPENTRPYDRIVRRYYNEYVNEWFERSLKPGGNKYNRITSKDGTDRWYSYFEANQARLTVRNWNLCIHCPEDLTNKWIDIFTSENIEEIMKYGDKTGRDGYTMVKNKWDDWFINQKYNHCFKNEDPEEWLIKFRSERIYFTYEQRPFNLDKIREKIAAIINEKNMIIYQPCKESEFSSQEKELSCTINENDPPYDQGVKRFNNELISEFYFLNDKIKDANKEFWFFNEAKMIKVSIDNWYRTYHPPQELVKKWLKIYDTLGIDEILDFGIRAVRDSMIILTLAFDDWVTSKKYEDCYIEGNIPKTIENLENFSYGKPPFPFDKISEKIEAMLAPRNQPGPKRENLHRKIY